MAITSSEKITTTDINALKDLCDTKAGEAGVDVTGLSDISSGDLIQASWHTTLINKHNELSVLSNESDDTQGTVSSGNIITATLHSTMLSQLNTMTFSTFSTLLLHLDNNVDDATGNNIPVNSGVSFSSGTKKFGTYSGRFSGGDEVQMPSIEDYILGSDDWTMDTWVYPNALYSDTGKLFYRYYDSGSNRSFVMYIGNGDKLLMYLNTTTTACIFKSIQAYTSNTWNHFAVERYGDNVYGYINGNKVTWDIGTSFTGIINPTSINYINFGGNYLDGYIDEARIVVGTACYKGVSFDLETSPYSE